MAVRRTVQKDAKHVFNQKYQKQHARAAEKIKLKHKSKTQPIRCKFDQQAQTSQPTSRMETPYSTYGSVLPVPPHYGDGDARETARGDSSQARQVSSPSNLHLKSFNSNTHTRKGSATPNEEELYKQIAMGMIDQDSKIVVVCNEQGTGHRQSPSSGPRVVSPQQQRASRASGRVVQFPKQVATARGHISRISDAQARNASRQA